MPMRRWMLLLACAVPLAAQPAPPTIFAAASLKPALDQLAAEGALGTPAPRLVYAASSALARQIEEGAPADLFISADEDWMDDAVLHEAVVVTTRRDLLGNALVLIAPADSTVHADLDHGAAPLLRALGSDGRLAIALPDSVPAGIYAKQALLKLGMWNALQPRMAMARDVRAALNLVVLGQCPLGIVYPAAIVKGHDNALTRALLAALRSPRADAIFRHWGFSVLSAPESKATPSANGRK